MSCPHGNHYDGCDICDEVDAAYNSGVEHTKKALAAQPAPNDIELMKCWVEKQDGTIDGIASMRLALSKYGTAAQRTWVGLTDDEMTDDEMYDLWLSADERKDRMAFGKAVEAKLKEKNNG